MSMPRTPELAVPEGLIHTGNQILPELTHGMIARLATAGWARVGLMMPLITRESKVFMFKHNQTLKTEYGMLGPLGETTKGLQPVIEQPKETLWRGLQEETGTIDPDSLELRMRDRGGWFINRWPVGVSNPGEFACAICAPVYVPPHTEERLLTHPTGSEEISGMHVMSPAEIRDTIPEGLRPGVHDWLDQLEATDFLEWPGTESHRIDFSSVFASSMVDLDLQTGL